jgi:hypothetical protein
LKISKWYQNPQDFKNVEDFYKQSCLLPRLAPGLMTDCKDQISIYLAAQGREIGGSDGEPMPIRIKLRIFMILETIGNQYPAFLIRFYLR